MLYYNVTTKIEDSQHDEWLNYMLKQHIPDVMRSGCFTGYKMCKLKDIEPPGQTYVFQYLCTNEDALNRYLENHAPDLRQDVIDKFGSAFIAFRSVMDIIEEG